MMLHRTLSRFFSMELGHGKIMVWANVPTFLIILCIVVFFLFYSLYRHNIMRETATARRSTIFDFKKSLSARKSVIAEALGWFFKFLINKFKAFNIIDNDSAWGNFAAQLNLIHLNTQEICKFSK